MLNRAFQLSSTWQFFHEECERLKEIFSRLRYPDEWESREQHDMEPEDIAQNFRILRKCQNKFDCLIFEMFFIKELKPTLSKQCDSIRAKLFV